MNKRQIGENAGKVWRLLNNNASWEYETLKKESGLNDLQLGAALGWLAREDQVEFSQEKSGDAETPSVYLAVNIYIG